VCSDSDPSLARIRQAIDDLAASPRDGADVAHRLDALWAMVAEVDPELTHRLAGYFPDAR
jgi:hypothetical protein